MFPEPNSAPASSLTGEVTADGKSCLVAMSLSVGPDTGGRAGFELKKIELDSGNVRSLSSLDDASHVSFARGGSHCTYILRDSRSGAARAAYLVVMQPSSGKITHRIDLNEPAPEADIDARNVTSDFAYVTVRGSHTSSYALARLSLEQRPRIVASLPKGPYSTTSTFKVSHGQADGRVAAILIPKKHQQRAWNCLLMDMEFEVLAELDVPAKSHVLDMRGGNYPMLFLADGHRWMLLSLEHDRLAFARSGLHRSPSDPGASIWNGAISPDGQWLVTTTAARFNSLAIWSTGTGAMVRQLPLDGFGKNVRFDTSGRFLSYVVVWQGQDRLYVWDFPSLVSTQRGVPARSMGGLQGPWQNGGR